MASTANLVQTLREQFFDLLFGETEGYICIAHTPPLQKKFREHFFQWPAQRKVVTQFIESVETKENVWFCINLMNKEQRGKAFALPLNLVWADLDECRPDSIEPPPQVVMETSPGRFQAVWRSDEILTPEFAEEYSRRIAYKYRSNGADTSGWDLTQLLRVPFTRNFKYSADWHEAPEVLLFDAQANDRTSLETLESLPEAAATAEELSYDSEMPDLGSLANADSIVYKYQPALRGTPFVDLYTIEPENGADWSRLLWRLIHVAFEAGMDAQEVFAVALNARCNKYARDKRNPKYLWRDVRKADKQQQTFNLNANIDDLILPTLVSDEELAALPDTIADEYIDWATGATDAVPIFHELSAFILLSTILAQSLILQTSYGPMVPNLWGLVLGDSTLTRKTTAMRMATDFVTDIDKELLLASDGSAEGLLTGLAGRPSRVSMYFKDEVSGLFDSMIRKDYLAGFPETLTQLYDVPEYYTRMLRKETITLRRPVFIFYGGGIRDKVYSLLTDEHVLSGFLPRFLIVSGQTDLSRIRRTGPANIEGSAQREVLRSKLDELYHSYHRTAPVMLGPDKVTTEIDLDPIEAVLTADAWERYGEIEGAMVEAASKSYAAHMAIPTVERLSRSLLKMSMLIAATHQLPNDEGKVIVGLTDVLVAAKYLQRWAPHSIDLVKNVGTTQTQRDLGKILSFIQRNPGVLRSRLMQAQRLTKRQMDEIEATLADRGQIMYTTEGKGKRYTAIG